MESSLAIPWPRLIADRVAFLWPLKAMGTMGFMALFFWVYFGVSRHPAMPPRVMPVIWLDTWIEFSPAALPAYLSLWIYVSLAPALLGSLQSLMRFGLWIGGLCTFCLAIFWLFPTNTPSFGIDWADHPDFVFLKGLDTAGNACPSLHVATTVFAAIWLERVLGRLGAPRGLRWLSALQCSVIIWSTIATRQHVVLDVVGGLGVGIAFAALSLRRAQVV